MSKEYDMRIAEAVEKEKREAARREEVLRAQNAKIEKEKREYEEAMRKYREELKRYEEEVKR